jgi:RNA polymerase sigma factor, sigma-70 family
MLVNYTELTDNELVKKVKSGEYEAFSELERRYIGFIWTKADNYKNQIAPDREDLIQEGYTGLFAAAKSYEENSGASFKTYAGVCISNQMVSALRQYSNKKNMPLNTSLPLDLEVDTKAELASSDEDPQILLEMKEKIRTFREKLTPFEFQVLSYYLSGQQREKVEENLKIPLKSYDNAMHRIRNKLK